MTFTPQSRPAEPVTASFFPLESGGWFGRLFTWLSRCRRLNTVFDRKPDLFAAHIWIAMISIISRRIASIGSQQLQGV
jgi:hypothetical protein